MWQAFMDANEVLDAVAAYKALRAACGVPDDASGRVAFDSTLAAVVGSNVPHKNKSLIQGLADNWRLRPTPKESAAPVRVVISGAGPVGLRAAVEAALNGFTVHVLEKRDIFSRVNILMLWQQTADDLVASGARSFYTKFTNRNIGNSPLHLGTREIQLVFLKNALLLGVTFSYGSELVAVQAPASGEGCWRAIARTAASTETHQTTGGVLDFKPNKMSDYSSGAGQGKCNMLQQSDLDGTFALSADTPLPSEVLGLEFDALLLAEGEWSPTCKRLGITKSIDRFTTAIGLVINMVLDPSEPKTKDPKMRSFTISPLDEIGRALKAAKIDFEFGEYLKGETHYIVLTIKKATLLAFGVLREDLSGPNLLTKANLDEPKLMTLSRQIATVIGLPESVEFTGFHPAKLFDFSTRARCLAPFRILGVRSGGAQAGQVAGMDLEAQPFLKESESKWYDRALADAEAEVAKRHKEREELEKAISDVSATLQQSMEAAADTMIDKVNKMVQSKAPPTLESRNSGVQDDEWEDSDDEERRKLSEQIAAQKAASERLTRSQLTQDRLDRQAMEKANAMQAGSGGGGDDDELGEDGKRKLTPEEEREMQEAQLELYQRALKELEEKTRVQQGQVDAWVQKRHEWRSKVADTEGAVERPVPVFPIGDAVLEPFWPQGLGSNRGFHSALDAVWAVHVMREEGLDAALLERNFWYDLMLQGPWKPGLLKPSKGWCADPVSRYVDGATVRSKAQYTNTQSKRLFRGEGAVPARIEALGLKAERGIGGASAWS